MFFDCDFYSCPCTSLLSQPTSARVRDYALLLFIDEASAMNITSRGDRTCFRHGAPCGGEPAGVANATYPVNSPITVHWQQNFNHYTVGNPG